MAQRTCVFCGARGVSKEHVIPSWVADQVPMYGMAAPYEHATTDSTGERSAWESDAFTFTVKRVCRACNHGWMNNDIEVPNQKILPPLFHGRSRLLTSAALAHVATWAFKTHLMAQYRHRPFRAVHADELRCLYENRRPTDKSRIWLGSFIGAETHTAWGRTNAMQGSTSPTLADVRARELVDIEAMTLCIGHLVLQSWKTSGGTPLDVTLPEAVKPFVVQIWPLPSGSVAWPTPLSFDTFESLSNFADAFVGPMAS